MDGLVQQYVRETVLSPGQWHGLVLSGFGTHLVYVHNVIDSPAPVFAEALERVMQDWTTDKGEELNAQFYANRQDQYTIVIEQPEQEDKAAALREQA